MPIVNKDPPPVTKAKYSRPESMEVRDWEKNPGFDEAANRAFRRAGQPFHVPVNRPLNDGTNVPNRGRR